MHIAEVKQPASTEQVEQIATAFTSAFGHAPSKEFEGRLNEKQKLMVLTAGIDTVDGFKIGYERYRGVFFSWLGGVRAECRRQGIAKALLEHQHRRCLELGYSEIQTETFGDGNAMLLLNLQNGFEVYGTHLGDDGRLRVLLRKKLSPDQDKG